ncbi:hypothetical protein M9H77_32299 [Catharanthus roseus]|uniref:Uncharacterized protein n=1 Tax=Catharanthus roseus TaxID=4058 RepID=A0ACC0A587_CATRO|nr:hypothetical protein M9H77_32299 [Catharanthus roseus]
MLDLVKEMPGIFFFTDCLTYSAIGASTRLTDVRRCSSSISGLVVAVSAASSDTAMIQQVVSESGNDYNFSVLSTAPATNQTSQYSRSAGTVEFRRSSQGNIV